MIAALALAPIVVGFLLFLLPRSAEAVAKWIGVAISAGVFVAAIALNGAPDESVRWLQRPFTANFHVALNGGLGFWLVLLLALSSACALVVPAVARGRDFVAQMMLLLGTMTGLFLARDLMLFALLWDAMLVPVFLILAGWAPAGSSAAWRYLLYNVTGGLALLLAVAAYGVIEGSTDVIGASIGHGASAIGPTWGLAIFAGLTLAFVVKTPLWPFHTWMPPTYLDLPAPAVAVVSAVQSKAGLYGFIAIALPLLPDQVQAAAGVMFVFGLVALVYGALVALVQDDAKAVVAYSSLSHLGLIVVAIFSGNQLALAGAAVYIVAHGLFSAGLFIAIGQFEVREETRSLRRLGGLAGRNPKLAGGLTIFALAALGLPGLCGFAGEILILTGVFRSGNVWPAGIALVPIVLAAAYMLRLFQDAMHGPEQADVPQRPDLSPLEIAALAPLVLAVVALGVNPAPVAGSTAPNSMVGEVRR